MLSPLHIRRAEYSVHSSEPLFILVILLVYRRVRRVILLGQSSFYSQRVKSKKSKSIYFVYFIVCASAFS